MTSTSLFTVALGLQPPWKVAEVAFDPQAGRIDFGVGFAAGSRLSARTAGPSTSRCTTPRSGSGGI